ncbi:Retrotransposon nucleocapsid protein [Phytophthora palmivora]|uniref:Retrotransposon nucleocapsid protein n=1 Tax=Phytophthora palmivora TaxID=4796 RepID=A0A2P4X6S4_9STRA|nr:Retrotransposon nucleocapsid protein [Phytophthora palmivora]
MKDFLAEVKAGEIAEMVLLKPETSPEDLNSSSVMDEDVLEGFTKQRATRLGSDILKNPEDPVYPLVKEYSDVVSKHPPSQLPPDRVVRHENDLVPSTKYCVTRQWPLPREQCEVIDAFFAEKAKSGMVRESKSPHSTPTFCVRKPNGKWRLVHAYNNALDLVDGYYRILMRESDIPLTATAMEVHLKHLRRVFEVMRANKFYANIDKCDFAAEVIKVLGRFVRRVGVRANPGKVKAIAAWPTPRSQKDVRKWLSLANYLHKYSAVYAELARPLSDLLKKDADWVCERQYQDAFDSIKASLQQAPVLALPDENKSFSVVCDASDYAIGCALLPKDDEGHERVISFQSRQLKAAERNYPVHDKELLAMKYALVKFRIHLLGTRPFVIYTDHASLRTAINSPHLSQRTAVYIKNRVFCKGAGRTPYEKVYGTKPDLHHLRTFGSLVYCHTPVAKRTKLAVNCKVGFLIGYQEDVVGCQVYFPTEHQKGFVADVKVNESIKYKDRYGSTFKTKVNKWLQTFTEFVKGGYFDGEENDSEGSSQHAECDADSVREDSNVDMVSVAESEELDAERAALWNEMVQNSVLPTFEGAPSSMPSRKPTDGDQEVWQDLLENCSMPNNELALVQTQEGEDEASTEDHENEDENRDHDGDFDDVQVESDDDADASASGHDYCEFDGDNDFADDLVPVSEEVEGDENGCDFLFDPSDEHEAEWNSNLSDEVDDPPRQSTQNPVRDDILGFPQQMLVGKVHPRDEEVRRTQDRKRT